MFTEYLTHRLQGRHALLEAALGQELRKPSPDYRRIADIKKRKLLVRDRLLALEPTPTRHGLTA